jgi:hypothetical protein
MALPTPITHGPGLVSKALHALVSQIPASFEIGGPNPAERARSLATSAALKAAVVSGSFTLPPGPLGLATVLPDLLAVWRIQQQLVADIAAAFGQTSMLTHETMVICLFKHGGAALTHRLFSRSGNDVLIQRIANRTLQQLLEKIAVRVTQRIAAKSVSRWIPLLGAVGAGAYAYYDTAHVAANAIELFSSNLQLVESPPVDEPPPAAKPRPKRKRTHARAKSKPPAKRRSRKSSPPAD